MTIFILTVIFWVQYCPINQFLHMQVDKHTLLQASIKLPKVLKQSYVHLSQNRESIMSKIGLMKAEGRHKLIVRVVSTV